LNFGERGRDTIWSVEIADIGRLVYKVGE